MASCCAVPGTAVSSDIARKLSGLEKIKVKETEVTFRVLKKIAAANTPNFLREFILKVRPEALIKGEAEADEGDTSEEDGDEAASPEEVDEGSSTDTEATAERVDLEEVQKQLTRLTEASKPDEL